LFLFRKEWAEFTTIVLTLLIQMVLKLVYTENAHSDDPYFYEKFYFTPGDLGLKPFLQKENRNFNLLGPMVS
jgi:hypothetical protein